MRKIRRETLAALLVATTSYCGISRAQQAQKPPLTAPRPVPNVIAPTPQPHRPSAQRQPSPGVIMGYVYWDASVIKHSPLNSCDGLSVTVDAGGGSLGTFSAGHFSYIPNVGTLGVCSYAVNQMPVGQNLQVLVSVTNAAAFAPAALPGGAAVSINIMGGNALCNNLPPAVPSPTDLTQGHWWTCPNYAYNVNFILVRAPGSLGSRVAGPVRVAPGAAVTLSPQPYPPKNATLLGSGEQKTLLGDGSVRPASGGTVGPSRTMSAQGNAGSNSGPATVPSKAPRKDEYEAITLDRGVTQDKAFTNWARSAQVPTGIRANPNIYVAQACTKDPSFRILFISGTSDGKTLTVGPQYTIWGCAFGNMPAAKRAAPPVTSQSQNQKATYPSNYNVAIRATPPSQPLIDVEANTIFSWSDNAVVVTFPARPTNHSGPSTAGIVLPVQVLLTRGDGQTRIFEGEGGVFFRFTN